MSGSEGAVEICTNNTDVESPRSGKKKKIQRKGSSLKLFPTKEELEYRSQFQKSDVIKDFPQLIKCTICQTNVENAISQKKVVYSHPLLKVLICKSCCNFYGNGNFSLDEDGEDKYCRWCGDGGKIFICSKCIFGFCPKCIKRHFGKQKVREIKEDDDWICFFCNPEPLWKLRTICHFLKDQSSQMRKSNGSSAGQTRKQVKNKVQMVEIEDSNNDDESSCLKSSSKMNTTNSSDEEEYESRSRGRKRKRLSGQILGDGLKCKASNTDTTESSMKEIYRSTKRRRHMSCGVLEKKSKRTSLENSKTVHRTRLKRPESQTSDSETTSAEEENRTYRRRIERSNEKEFRQILPKKYSKKLKDILAILEAASDRCFRFCRSKVKRLERRDRLMSTGSLMSECDEVKSMIIVLSSSLSTVHNLLITLQQKFGFEVKAENVISSNEESTLLKAIVEILRQNNVKTSYLLQIVNDIQKRYPSTRTGSNGFDDFIKNIITTNNLTDDMNSDFRAVTCNFGSVHNFLAALNDNTDHSKDVSVNGNIAVTDFNDHCQNPRAVSQSEISNLDSDLSTEIFEIENKLVHGKDSPARTIRPLDVKSLPEFKDKEHLLVVNSELEKLHKEALKIKQQLLNSSSDSSVSVDDSMLNRFGLCGDQNSSCSSHPTRMKVCRRPFSSRRKSEKKKDEDKELNNLLNLSTLDRKTSRNLQSGNHSDKSKEKISLKRSFRRKNATEDESSSSDYSSTNSCSDFTNLFRPNTHGRPQWMEDNALMLKKFILETTNSETSSSIDLDEPKKGVNKKMDREKSQRSRWRNDPLLRNSESESDLNSNEEEQNWKEKWSNEKTKRVEEGKEKKTLENGETSSDETGTTISFEKPKLFRKRIRMLDSTELDDSSSESVVEYTPTSSHESPGRGRRNIKKILKKESLHLETKQALKMENERKKRLAEKNELYEKLFSKSEEGRLVLDFNRETKEVLVEVPWRLAVKLKPHQKEGVKFMWDCCFESVDNLEVNTGSGCVLAHCMGLGKTLQIITLIHTVRKNNLGVHTILILCPLNVVNNWISEFRLWLKESDIDIYTIHNCKKTYERFYQVRDWHQNGGVLILSYDMMRNLASSSRKKRKDSSDYTTFLLDPGPDLVICDEGHLLKNEETALSKCMRKIKTSRRIILTGTPLQNNILEYYTMVQFIKPNILGTKKEFMNRFGNPINNGRYEDSTAADVKLMRARSHVLHKLLDGCIQRFDYSVLTPFLPEKHEYVISIRLTDTQVKLYEYYADLFGKRSAVTNKLFKDFQWLHKIWTHPKTFSAHAEKTCLSSERNGSDEDMCSASEDSVICISTEDPKEMDPSAARKMYWKEVIKPEEYEDIGSSGKLVVLFCILKRCREIGDKVLVFSQSLSTLNLIEHFLKKINTAFNTNSNDVPMQYRDSWIAGIDYFRLDGSTKPESRSKWCKSFNKVGNYRSRLFLISTKAGGLGINLVAANRVVIFDVSWNPSHDVQSIFRVYRFGQKKTCYIYRLFAEATMEEKIYERQVTKLSLEKRVLDEHQIERHYSMGKLQELYKYDPLPKEKWVVPKVPKDMLLAEILNSYKDTIVSYHEHDSLLENKEAEELTEEERKAAWDDFEREKFAAELELERRQFSKLPAEQPTVNPTFVGKPWFSSPRTYPGPLIVGVQSLRQVSQPNNSANHLPNHTSEQFPGST